MEHFAVGFGELVLGDTERFLAFHVPAVANKNSKRPWTLNPWLPWFRQAVDIDRLILHNDADFLAHSWPPLSDIG